MIKRLGFSHKILLAASLLVVSTFGLFALYNDYQQSNAISRDLQRNLRGIAEVTADNIRNWLGGRRLLLESLAEVLAHADEKGREQWLRQQTLKESLAFVYLGTDQGSFHVFPETPMPKDYDPRSRPWFQQARQAAGSQLTEPYLDANTNQLTMTIATPVTGVGVVGADLELQGLVTLIDALNFDGMGYAFLVSGDGKVLVHPDRQFMMQPAQNLFAAGMPPLEGGKLSQVQSQEGERIVTFMPVQGLPGVNWYLGISLDKNKAFAVQQDFRSSALTATSVAVSGLLILMGMLIRLLLRPLHALTNAMEDIAQGHGDLTRRLPVNSKDEFGLLAKAFNGFVERIHDSIREVNKAMGKVDQVARQVISSTTITLDNTQVQASRTGNVAAAINQLGAAALEIAGNAAMASQRASTALIQAHEGREVVERNIDTMTQLSSLIQTSSSHISQLNGKTEDIGQILEVISSISQQTNLLALNAAIEAARAGEAGRGFAVVADEVRNLAHRTQQSALEVQQLIEELQAESAMVVGSMQESQRQSGQSVEVACQVGHRLTGVTDGIEQMDGMNQSVAAATEEQSAVVETINQDISEIDLLNQSGAKQMRTTVQACSELQRQVSDLTLLLGKFQV
ncbi:methyl-accepting chemotaxis protein [Pseudomonas sp. NPDC089569]|uniref:methyl-accepting chemotaxis protein n=1 Tax=Pseudomonas sp. NPDC089569 TaxID=3390722 RepID=UPI003CFE41DA